MNITITWPKLFVFAALSGAFESFFNAVLHAMGWR